MRHLISRILDPDPSTRIKAHEIRRDPWFRQGYVRVYAVKEDEEAAESAASSSAKDLAAIFTDMAVSEVRGGWSVATRGRCVSRCVGDPYYCGEVQEETIPAPPAGPHTIKAAELISLPQVLDMGTLQIWLNTTGVCSSPLRIFPCSLFPLPPARLPGPQNPYGGHIQEETIPAPPAGPHVMNAFELISLSHGLDLGVLFHRLNHVVHRNTRFASRLPADEIMARLEAASKELGCTVVKGDFKVRGGGGRE